MNWDVIDAPTPTLYRVRDVEAMLRRLQFVRHNDRGVFYRRVVRLCDGGYESNNQNRRVGCVCFSCNIHTDCYIFQTQGKPPTFQLLCSVKAGYPTSRMRRNRTQQDFVIMDGLSFNYKKDLHSDTALLAFEKNFAQLCHQLENRRLNLNMVTDSLPTTPKNRLYTLLLSVVRTAFDFNETSESWFYIGEDDPKPNRSHFDDTTRLPPPWARNRKNYRLMGTRTGRLRLNGR